MKYISLTQGKQVIVDDENYEWLSQWEWCVIKNKNTWYATRTENGKTIYMHREILSAKKGQVTDHKNHNGIDNRLCNIRLCNYTQNKQNANGHKNSTSKYKGASWHKKSQKWQAKITLNKKRIQLGLFDKELDAAKTYDVAALKYFGEFAYTNF